MVTKERFLSSIVDVYNFRQIRDGAFLTQSLSENHFELFDQFTFKETIHMIDPWIHDGKIADLYTEALAVSQTPGLADKDAFVKIALRHGIGKYGLGSFVIRELLDVLTERQFVVDISLQPGENISFKKIEDLDSKKTPSRGSTAEETKDHYTPKFLRKRGPQS